MTLKKSLLVACLGLGIASDAARAADEEAAPGVEALEDFRYGRTERNPVLNRFFLKKRRFELTPLVGFVPNNPFVRRFTVALGFGYHFSETLAISGMFSFAPDLGERDLKGLTEILLRRANDTEFQQPLDKFTLQAAFGVTWAPLYGKINLIGELVLNFDFYMFVGMGLALQTEYTATQNPQYNPDDPASNFVVLGEGVNDAVRAAPTVGLGGNFFLSQTVALRLDARMAIIPDDRPVYDPDEVPDGLRVVTPFTFSAGFAFFFPKMKPRLYDF